MTAGCKRILRSSQIIRIILISVVASLILEAGTVWGSYDSSLLSLSCWSPRRIVIFFVLSALVTSFFVYRARNADDTGRAPTASLATRVRNGLRTTLVPFVIGIGISALVAVFARLFTGIWDIRYSLCTFTFLLIAFLFASKREFLLAHVEWGFLSIALPVGVLMSLLMPAYANITWDGTTHFDHANALSYVISPQYDGADKLMVTTNSADWHLMIQVNNAEDIALSSLDTPVVDNINRLLNDASTSEEVTKIDGMKTLQNEPMLSPSTVGLLPQAIGLWLGRLFKLPPVLRYAVARMCSTFVYCVVFFFAIRRIRFGKLIVACIGLIPTGFLMVTNFSYDSWHLAFIAYAFSHYLGILQDKEAKFELKDAIIIATSFFLGATVKAIVFPLAFVFMYMPKERLGDRVSLLTWRAIISTMTVLLVASFALPFLFSGGSSYDDSRGGGEISGIGQIQYVLTHPINFTITLVRFLSQYLSASQISLGVCFTAPYLYPDEGSAHFAIATLQLVLMTAVTLFDREQSRAPKALSLISLLCSCAAVGLICLALYISYNPVGSTSIGGVQSRYLIPLLPAIMLICLNLPVSDTLDTQRRTDLFFRAQTSILILLITCVFVLRF